MALRNTRFITKNSDIVNRPLPSSLLAGEAIINTADGILWYSGVTTSTNEWTPAGTGTTANFFEVGSNLYDLKIRNQITSYQDITGAGLVGKFLSGTTSGFVLADISSISGVDSFITGGTFSTSTDTLTLDLNNGQPSVNITGIADEYTTGSTLIGSVAYFDRTDALSAYTLDLSTFISTGDTYTTGFTYDDANSITLTQTQGEGALSVYIDTMTGLTVTGTLSAITLDGGTILSGGTDMLTVMNSIDTFITGGTVSYIGADGTVTLTNDKGGTVTITGFTDDYTTGSTLIGDTLYFDRVGSLSAYTADLSALDTNDTFVSGYTYNSTNSTFTIDRNDGTSFSALINEVSGLTVANLTAGRVVYVGTSGLLTDEAGFTYDDSGNVLSTPTDGRVVVGTGGLEVGSGGSIGVPGTGAVVIHGDLTVFGDAISAFTSELYVEDPTITINYNPTGTTNATSIGAGWVVQDGDGVSNDVHLEIRPMDTFTGLTATDIPDITEYGGSTGYDNRAWITQLNDIVIRSTDVTIPNGVRVLAEFDILDGGTF